MHKKLEAELVSLAHSIIQSKNTQNLTALKEKAQLIYEKLAILSFVDKSMDSVQEMNNLTPKQAVKTEPKIKVEEKIKPIVTTPKKEKEIFEPKFDDVKIDIGSLKPNQISLKEEFRDTVSADKTSTLFDEEKSNEKKTLNDKLLNNTIQVGLNDRIAFVKYLFNYSQEAFNNTLSKLNAFKTEKEAKEYIQFSVKPNYDWSSKEEFEERLLLLIERKFS